MTERRLSGRVAIVTGGAIGLGRTMAEYLAAFGASVAIVRPCALRSPRSSPPTSSTWNPALYAPTYSVSPSAHTLWTPPFSGSMV